MSALTVPYIDVRSEMARRIISLPPEQQRRALADVEALYGPRADILRRRRWAMDPWAYAREVFDYRLTPQQERALEIVVRSPRVLIPAAQNVGKSWMLGFLAVWRFHCTSALPDPDLQIEQQGARILLPGPDSKTIFATIYGEMLKRVVRATARGHKLPGAPSEKSVLWGVPGHPQWEVEAFSPANRTGMRQAHGASGRHHRNQHAFIEEGAGVSEVVWTSVEGMCSGGGNTIVSAYNPTEPTGPVITREKGGEYVVIRLSALDHPNIRSRMEAWPGAIGHARIDSLVASDCQVRGSWPETIPDPEYGDFAYALPPPGAVDPAPHPLVPGHRDGAPMIYRPGPTAEVSVLGRTASTSSSGLFRAEAIVASNQRWRDRTAPAGPPARVGVDPAREGRDDSMAAPAWGESAESLLLAYAAAERIGPYAVLKLQEDEKRRAYVGRLVTISKGDGPHVARELRNLYPDSPFTADDGGVGTSPIDHLRRVLHAQVGTVSFGGVPPAVTPGEPQAENMRTAIAIRLARLLMLNLVDLPPDQRLMQELLALELEVRSRSVEQDGRMVRVTSYLLCSKDAIKAKIGRSPDSADAVELALTEVPDLELPELQVLTAIWG